MYCQLINVRIFMLNNLCWFNYFGYSISYTVWITVSVTINFSDSTTFSAKTVFCASSFFFVAIIFCWYNIFFYCNYSCRLKWIRLLIYLAHLIYYVIIYKIYNTSYILRICRSSLTFARKTKLHPINKLKRRTLNNGTLGSIIILSF